jgi:ZIP family zinc transporter
MQATGTQLIEPFLGACTVLGATTLGAAAVLVFKRVSGRFYATTIAFCAGMMAFSALEMVTQSHALAGHRVALSSLLVGMTAFFLLDRLLPHAHMLLHGTEMQGPKRKVALLVGTITIHNIPEGFALAAAFASSPSLGWLVTATVALQDIPEGLMVAAPVACYGVASRRSFLWGVFSGAVEFAAAMGGFLFLRGMTTATPLALGFAAGAMGYVVLSELLPDAMQAGSKYVAFGAFIAGIAAAYGFSTLIGF